MCVSLQIMSLMYQPPLGPTPSLVFSLVRIKSGMTGEAVIWMDSAGSPQDSLPASFAGIDVATVFRGLGGDSTSHHGFNGCHDSFA